MMVKLITGVISPTFLEQLFCTRVTQTAVLKFRYNLYERKEIGAKAAHKMLVKLTTERIRREKGDET
jgi:hypothetical protein